VIALWTALLVVSLVTMALASREAVGSAMALVEHLGWSPAVVGLAILAVGTDLPEIANSIVSTASGHGDVNVGDSIGSTITQVTLILGVLCLAGANLTRDRGVVIGIGTATFFGVLLVWALLQDGALTHADGLILVVGWAGGTVALSRGRGPSPPAHTAGRRTGAVNISLTLGWLAVIGFTAWLAITAFVEITDALGVPEFLASFVALSIGTSLPELAVDLTALRRGATTMAIGEVFGSSFIDATLSIGVGPALFGSEVSTDVLPAVAAAGVGVLATTVFVATTPLRGWRPALPLFGIYVAVYAVAFI
jgi:cation:H+ antiporter